MIFIFRPLDVLLRFKLKQGIRTLLNLRTDDGLYSNLRTQVAAKNNQIQCYSAITTDLLYVLTMLIKINIKWFLSVFDGMFVGVFVGVLLVKVLIYFSVRSFWEISGTLLFVFLCGYCGSIPFYTNLDRLFFRVFIFGLSSYSSS